VPPVNKEREKKIAALQAELSRLQTERAEEHEAYERLQLDRVYEQLPFFISLTEHEERSGCTDKNIEAGTGCPRCLLLQLQADKSWQCAADAFREHRICLDVHHSQVEITVEVV
jgi:hypothetical protein